MYSRKRRNELLEKSTSAEKAACAILDKLGIKFIRQYPIWTTRRQYYADIYIPKYKLILEIDGKYHYTKEQTRKDENRSAGIRRLGYHVCRLSNADARRPERIIGKIKLVIKKL
jgi:very-short-patch-repair endonuclease